jgi:hypothetical protein
MRVDAKEGSIAVKLRGFACKRGLGAGIMLRVTRPGNSTRQPAIVACLELASKPSGGKVGTVIGRATSATNWVFEMACVLALSFPVVFIPLDVNDNRMSSDELRIRR